MILSRNGWVRARQDHSIDAGSLSYKTGDFPFALVETRSTWPLVVIDGNGRGSKPAQASYKPAQLEVLRHRRARKGVSITPKLKPSGIGFSS